MARPVPAVLSIAGSDSGGGAGIQADLKAFARCGVHGMTAITALTAQSTVGVTAIHPVPGEFIVEQVRTVAADIGVDAVKIGMLGTADTVRAVREALRHIEDGVPIVIDPVMVAESGAVLLDDEARAAIVTELLPLATVITPNLPEARVLVAGAEAVRGGTARRRGRARGAGPWRGHPLAVVAGPWGTHRGGGAWTAAARALRRHVRLARDRHGGRARRRRGSGAGAARARTGQRGRHGWASRRGHGRLLRRHEHHLARRGAASRRRGARVRDARIRARSRRIWRWASAPRTPRGRRGGWRRRRCATDTAASARDLAR